MASSNFYGSYGEVFIVKKDNDDNFNYTLKITFDDIFYL